MFERIGYGIFKSLLINNIKKMKIIWEFFFVFAGNRTRDTKILLVQYIPSLY